MRTVLFTINDSLNYLQPLKHERKSLSNLDFALKNDILLPNAVEYIDFKYNKNACDTLYL